MRKLRSKLSRCWDSSPPGVAEGAAFSKGTGKVRLTSCPSQSQWFADFLLGAQDQMGYDTKKQLPLSILAIVKILEMIKLEMEERETEEAHGKIPNKFKRNQLLTEAEVMKLPSVCICLIGKFKGETEELMKLCQEEGTFADADDVPPDSTEYNALFCQYLSRLQKQHQDLFSSKEDITHYGISRSLRKSAVTRAGKAGLLNSEIGLGFGPHDLEVFLRAIDEMLLATMSIGDWANNQRTQIPGKYLAKTWWVFVGGSIDNVGVLG
ncbi:hypothetical protein ACHAWO_007436 [Cyclotella atomus]|uniref:Uncharacterized protein n=1 Tax=Cyclotella atomus TaxID=382360 RepID=A0ABD3PGM4_9STRA